ncbi:C-3 sterol dehydrogenase/C-4 decarboxylase family protein [Byssothecium circinans]|uniref:C-3 sterol dehydrogenase/C-4 decarboxylase family protein n=1 Tax=Byssothecium circinans TaxID=147558 RepID=A0A6A5TFK7_9PLEO|nr:C-3 sterol dehydrogenase/C-4 decarboxylase family protein [Byssothecium circinans]
MALSSEDFGSVLVTGGCGFQGHHLVSAILEAEPNCNVYVFDIDTNRPSRRHTSVTYFTGDIADSSSVDVAFADMKPPPRVIFHIACPPSMSLDPRLHWRVNVEGTRNLLASADRVGSVRALVLTSTSSVGYDGVAELKDVKELPVLDASKQSRGYSRSKGVCEQEILSANRNNSSGMLTCVIRPCTTFGPDDPHFFQNIVDVVKNGQAKYRFGKGQNLFDFIYVGNACHAHLLAAHALLAAHGAAPLPATKRVEGEVFNITNDDRIPFWDLTIKTSNLLGSPVSHDDIVSIPKAVGLFIGFLAEWLVRIFSFGKRQSKMSVTAMQYTFLTHTMNIDKAKTRLHYTPQCSLQEGLERTVDWYREKDKKQ